MTAAPSKLRDYSADSRILYVSALAACLGAISAVAAWLLVDMIRGCTNLFFLHRWSVVRVNPWSVGRLWWVPFLPVLGGLAVGLIARFLSPAVRGHGMPEAVETIVFKGGRVQPRVAVLKPVATAISIGTGGPFGAEGPVIMTGGAIGSVLGQLLTMSDSERTVLMVSGAASGMAATFNCPMASTLLAVEILLFEWKPRSLVPVAMACVTATAVRRLLLGPSPILNMAPTQAPVYHAALLGALAVGIVAAFFAAGLGKLLHYFESMFEKLPVHWMWWPAIGGAGVGLLSLIFPQGLGIGHSNIEHMIAGDTTVKFLLGILIFKTLMWSFSLGSNTAGGILSPLLMIGGALGATMGHWMPFMDSGAWALVGMTSLLSASIGAPLTCAMLALEMTHNGGLMLPVLLGCASSYAVSVLVQKRSMLTADMSRRGLHLTRELGVDPLESMLVSQAMHTSVFALPVTATQKDAAEWLRSMDAQGGQAWSHWQRIFPVVDGDGKLVAMLTRAQMISVGRANGVGIGGLLLRLGVEEPRTISPVHTLKACANSMAATGITSFPVVAHDGKLLGIITINDLLKGRSKEELRESARERVLRLRWPFNGSHPVTDGPVTATVPMASPAGQSEAAAIAAADDELISRH